MNDWNEKGNSRKWRKDLTDTINVVNDRIGLPEYWEHRSFKELGLEQEPTRHLGPIASALEWKGIRTEKGDANRAIMEHNQTLQRARMFYDIAWNSVKIWRNGNRKAAEAAKNAAEKKAGKWQETSLRHRKVKQNRRQLVRYRKKLPVQRKSAYLQR